MAKELKLTSSKGEVLSKEQKKFNKYISNIKKGKDELILIKAFNVWLNQEGMRIIAPPEKEYLVELRKLVMALHQSEHLKGLSKKLKDKHKEIMSENLKTLIDAEPDEEIIAIYDFYNEVSYKEEQMRAEQAQKAMFESIAKTMFGMDIDLSDTDFSSMEDIANLQNQMQEAAAQAEQAEKERKEKRKKTPKQLESELKKKEAELKLKQNTKKVYLELVKHFHPDQEQDEAEKERKTAIMQEITAAYKADDFLKLLELQVTMVADNEKAVANLKDEVLVYYNKVLKEQLDDIEQQKQMLHTQFMGSPFGQYIDVFNFDYYTEAGKKKVLKNLKEEAKDFEAYKNRIIHTMNNQLADKSSFTEFLKSYDLAEEEMDFSDMLRMVM